MPGVCDCYVMVHCTDRFWDSKWYYLMVRFSISCRCYGKTTLVSILTSRTLSSATRLAGYDLKQLFIGAEGTLGIITGVSILTYPAPQASNNIILALPCFDNVLPLYKTVKRELSEILSAFEFMDRASYDLAVKHGQGRALSDEDVAGAECFVLVETSGCRFDHDEEVRTRSFVNSSRPSRICGIYLENQQSAREPTRS
jgi:FAD/FMN-containing dehydrogenase